MVYGVNRNDNEREGDKKYEARCVQTYGPRQIWAYNDFKNSVLQLVWGNFSADCLMKLVPIN